MRTASQRPLGGGLSFCAYVAMHESLPGPSVWTGRALQAESDDLEKLVLRFCIRPHMMVSPSRANEDKP